MFNKKKNHKEDNNGSAIREVVKEAISNMTEEEAKEVMTKNRDKKLLAEFEEWRKENGEE